MHTESCFDYHWRPNCGQNWFAAFLSPSQDPSDRMNRILYRDSRSCWDNTTPLSSLHQRPASTIHALLLCLPTVARGFGRLKMAGVEASLKGGRAGRGPHLPVGLPFGLLVPQHLSGNVPDCICIHHMRIVVSFEAWIW